MLSLIGLAEAGWIPSALIRSGIRRLLARRLTELARVHAPRRTDRLAEFTDQLRDSPVAIETTKANEQHYEVPPEFFMTVLGPRLKYSACYFANPESSLASAEETMLWLTCERAEIRDGHHILELGCGWGSLTLWMAEHFPRAKITAVSNSISQRQFIERRADARGLTNVRVITADVQKLKLAKTFDRVVSVEMFEHMRNYEVLLRRVSRWLTPAGKAFIHIFCHRDTPYLFQSDGAANWMGKHFFTGGMMPSENLLHEFQDDLRVERQWRVNGLHYWRTCEAWLKKLERHRDVIVARFSYDLSDREAQLCWQRWRIFFMACAELFRYRDGEEWFVAHYRLMQQPQPARIRSRKSVIGSLPAVGD